MQLASVGVREGASDKSLNLGTWSAGFDNNMSLVDPQYMSNLTADVVYRVVTVIVSVTLLSRRIFYFNIISNESRK